ncbi:hypothetical protein ACIQB5_23580 [Streptomyces sp. NPDC088560]|uniref:hypothetical protein n=1 Tax=Streptomyces sp. NPDC088560 TaxID=3365868 RepID=UPI00382509E9
MATRLRLVRQHLEAGGTRPTAPGKAVHQGEDLEQWVRQQILGFHTLTGVQRWMCAHILRIEPAAEEEKPAPRRARSDRGPVDCAVPRQYYVREGHLPGTQGTRPGDRHGRRRGPHRTSAGGTDREPTQQTASLPPERVEQHSAADKG